MTTVGTAGYCGKTATYGLTHYLFVDAYLGGDWSCNYGACRFAVMAPPCKEDMQTKSTAIMKSICKILHQGLVCLYLPFDSPAAAAGTAADGSATRGTIQAAWQPPPCFMGIM